MSERSIPPQASYSDNSSGSGNRETRQIVTPYAFQVAEELLGQPLASPWRRVLAQGIDLAVVAILSGANSIFLALLLSLTFFKAGSNLAHREERSATRKILRVSGAVLLFLIAWVTIEGYQQTSEWDDKFIEVNGLESSLIKGAFILGWNQCDGKTDCMSEVAGSFGESLGESGVGQEKAMEFFTELLEQQTLTAEQSMQLSAVFNSAYQSVQTPGSDPAGTEEPAQTDTPLSSAQTASPTGAEPAPQPDSVENSHSVIAWIKGILGDLGLGFGWAALYYSVCTAWWRGYTPGKRLMGIKVLKLDGTTMTLWESFGRYGGYGAGLATGLLGFLQILWDPNRQGIQDKIAETLVLRHTEQLSAITRQTQSQAGVEGEGI
ncbi:RDD family protein [Alteromonas aestuariivivens]|uniref:RDD family protein n=1 Tax=Alteromonas aestuariivivens TaxID=1938339 RepID=A0A3D8MAF8_9ALTE|nr:RDD family protein [Alteromonas aestuariivivens]RDV27344.1 RDD family protein [Alteromonas aestuariivivens]